MTDFSKMMQDIPQELIDAAKLEFDKDNNGLVIQEAWHEMIFCMSNVFMLMEQSFGMNKDESLTAYTLSAAILISLKANRDKQQWSLDQMRTMIDNINRYVDSVDTSVYGIKADDPQKFQIAISKAFDFYMSQVNADVGEIIFKSNFLPPAARIPTILEKIKARAPRWGKLFNPENIARGFFK